MRLKLHHQILIAMVAGAAIGLPLNIFAGPHTLLTIPPGDAPPITAGPLTDEVRTLFNNPALSMARFDEHTKVVEERAGRRWRIDGIRQSYVLRRTNDAFLVQTGGYWPRTVAAYGKKVGDVFLRLLSMVVAPLILCSLVSGVTSSGNLEGLGRLGGRTLAFYIATSAIAIFTGVLLFNIINPGRHAKLDLIEDAAEAAPTHIISGDQSLGDILWDQVFNLIPSNPFAALSDPSNTSILGVIFFALLFGIFIVVVGGEHGQLLTRVFNAGFDVMMKMTMFIIHLAPVGVLGFMLYASAGKGLDVFVSLGWYVITVALGLSIHSMITMPLILKFIARRSPVEYVKQMSPALLTAFSTASSNGTLPITMNCVEERAGIRNRISSFVLPLGATINMDGTALYEAAAVLFIGQVTGHELTFAQQMIVAFTALLASVGAAGIPHAGTVMMVVVLSAVNLPLAGVGLILAVDRPLDMFRTTVNVWGDMTACAVVSRFEGDAPPTPANTST